MESPGYGSSRSRAIFLIFVASGNVLFAQVPPSQQEKRAKEIPYILHVTTREVVIDVIAVDSHDRAITDLTANTLHVSEKIDKTNEIPEAISSFRLVDPNAAGSADLPPNGFGIASNESCLQRQSIHYQLVYNPGPQALTEGNHEVHIKTSRRGVRLFYRHSYYVGVTAPRELAVSQTRAQKDQELWLDACSHPRVPPSISLRAVRIFTGSINTARYKLNIENHSLAFVSFSDGGRGLQLDYGACNFNAAGQPINFMTATTDQVLTPVEYARAEAHGLPRILEFASPADLAMTRFVVRDRATGNLGLADVVSVLPDKPPVAAKTPVLDATIQQTLAVQERAVSGDVNISANSSNNYFRGFGDGPKPLPGLVGSYGSVVPKANAFCGDVFELRPGVSSLPDFRELDPIGSIYTGSLAVPYQNLPQESVIPGVTDRFAWFGVDYHATFWVSNPGRYEFKLMSDDGSSLQIDEKRIAEIDGLHTPKKAVGEIVLDAGRHTIHLPYFQGTPTGVALALWVRPPNGTWQIFDLHDFEEPRRKTD
jgi:hypothetical protein